MQGWDVMNKKKKQKKTKKRKDSDCVNVHTNAVLALDVAIGKDGVAAGGSNNQTGLLNAGNPSCAGNPYCAGNPASAGEPASRCSSGGSCGLER